MSKINAPCRFFSSPAGCRNGSSCSFQHQQQNSLAPPPAQYGAAPPYTVATTGATARTPAPCRFFASASGCRSGNSCPYVHTAGVTPAVKLPTLPPVETRHLDNLPLVALDVECVATGYGHLDRAVGRIAAVNEAEEVIFDSFVKPAEHVTSCLTPLTGIVPEDLESAKSFEEALVELRAALPKECVVLGQSIAKDLEWLKLVEGQDFKTSFDVAQLFKISNGPNAKRQFRFYSLRHVAKHLMGVDMQEEDHDPIVDAQYALKLFKKYRYLHENRGQLSAVRETLTRTPPTPSFSMQTPFVDGVAMSLQAANQRAAAAQSGGGATTTTTTLG